MGRLTLGRHAPPPPHSRTLGGGDRGLATWALAAGPGGWDHLGDRGTPGSNSLNLVASALEATPSGLYVGGKFTDAGGIPNADRIAKWNGSNWSAVSSSTEQITNGEVFAIAVAGGKVYAGGMFTNAGTSGADNLAVWDGASWEPFCTAPGQTIGNVKACRSSDRPSTSAATSRTARASPPPTTCSRATWPPARRAPPPPTEPPFSGPVKALAATSDGTLYAGGRFANLENIAAADNVAYLPHGGAWHADGRRAAARAAVRSTPSCAALTAIGTDVFVGTEGTNVAGIAQADHVAKWDGSAWSAMGANSAGTNGWFPAATNIYALTSVGSNVFATGTFQNAERRRARRQRRLVRRHRVAPGRVQRRRQRPVGRRGLRPRDRRPAALRGGELHQRRWRPPGAVGRLVRAHADHRLPDAHGHPRARPRGPDADGDPWPEPGPDAHRDPDARRHAAAGRRCARRRSITASARRRSGSPPARRARSSSASSTRRSTSPAPRRRPTRSSSPASTCSASRHATGPATSTGRRWSSGSGSSGGSAASGGLPEPEHDPLGIGGVGGPAGLADLPLGRDDLAAGRLDLRERVRRCPRRRPCRGRSGCAGSRSRA